MSAWGNSKVKGLRIFFVQFYEGKMAIPGGKAYIPAIDKASAEAKVAQMILTGGPYVPSTYDRWAVE